LNVRYFVIFEFTLARYIPERIFSKPFSI